MSGWEGGNEGEIGILRMVPKTFNKAYADDIESYIDQKILDFFEEYKK
jgi:hypothetical protein